MSGWGVPRAHVVLPPQGRRVTGAVGADNWAGGLLELQENETFVPNPHLNESGPEGYLGEKC